MRLFVLRADRKKDIRKLVLFDRIAFGTDAVPAEDWRSFASYWLRLGKLKVGAVAFKLHADEDDRPEPRCLYLASIGIHPKFRGKGFGVFLMAWTLSYARIHSFARIALHVRESNKRAQRLYGRFNFRRIGSVKKYYEDPKEDALIMAVKF